MSESLDDRVEQATLALARAAFPSPRLFYFCATGLGLIPEALERVVRVPLSEVDGVPKAWSHLELFSGEANGENVWILEDACGEPELGGAPVTTNASWIRAFPVWLAASQGATVMVQSRAGAALPGSDLEADSVCVIEDHINLSGRTPLYAIGESDLGPLFPDQSQLHHETLREALLELADKVGIKVSSAVCACTLGPTIDTPAERSYYASTGATVAVQGMSDSLIAAAHAGMASLSLVAILDDSVGALDMPKVVSRAESLAPSMDELLLRILPNALDIAGELATEEAL